ncbi:XdhC family protein [Oceaniradius stylonematis]|uniref:XdhC family protein n=1 Tax=Oceaniradius stylonematis TaxID=2184161 RepID=UPI0035D048B2
MLTRAQTVPPLDFGPNRAPLAALATAQEDGVLAVITRTEGPSYRPVGAVMAFLADDMRIGTLSSGCIESDLALHAAETLDTGTPKTVLYGRGSPYIDIQLPCGGGLEILLVPRPDKEALARMIETLDARRPATLVIDRQTGQIEEQEDAIASEKGRFAITFEPELQFFIFGKGPEASTFAGLVQSAGYPNLLLSPDEETLEAGRAAGCATHHLVSKSVPSGVAPDGWSSVVLFFHDHDWEPPILESALETDAFYIGAQGSKRARDARLAELEAMGVAAEARERLHGPIGLVPSARDARTLAVSVLAEVLAVAKAAA